MVYRLNIYIHALHTEEIGLNSQIMIIAEAALSKMEMNMSKHFTMTAKQILKTDGYFWQR